MKVPTFTKSGTKATTEATLDKAVFGREVTPELIKTAYNRTLANQRQSNAQTKTRGLISGGGKKPFRQKGTGRARSGSTRNPLWRGGGTIFGPTGEENYSITLPKKAIRTSIAQALSLKVEHSGIQVIEDFEITSGKTKDAVAFIDKLKLTGKVLVVGNTVSMKTRQAVSNIQTVAVIPTQSLTVYAIMNADVVLLSKDSLETLSTWLAPTIKGTAK